MSRIVLLSFLLLSACGTQSVDSVAEAHAAVQKAEAARLYRDAVRNFP